MSELVNEVAELTLSSDSSTPSTTSTSSSIPTHHIPIDDSTVDYGAAAANLPGHSKETYYITTAIAYTNGYPHMGHAYEFLSADVLARYHRILGYDTFFLTGADEHGQKVASSAEKNGLNPKEHCDIYVGAFKALNQKLCVKYNGYVRTTDTYHKDQAKKLWKKCAESGDIYLDRYEGWYNEREETFVTETEALEMDYKDTGSGLPLKKVTEESYFFRMSKYLDRLLHYIEVENPDFVQPEALKNQILVRLRKDGLRDLSISRTSFTWGIPVPEGFDDRHVMYVWFDALSNYTSGVEIFDESSPIRKYWPAQSHVIGKDIVWFHTVIWPCMLMSAEIPVPRGVFSHGFINAADGRKMSKSYNNAVDPHDIVSKYSSDTIRYYFCNHVYGNDINFTESAMITMHNSELADVLGNLVHRALTLIGKYSDHIIPNSAHDPAWALPFEFEKLANGIREDMKSNAIESALSRTMEAVRNTNKFITEAEPWKMKGGDEVRRAPVVRTTLEAIYAFTHFLAPIIPHAAKLIFDALQTPPKPVFLLRNDLYNLTPGTKVVPCKILFSRIEVEKNKKVIPESGVKAKKKAAQELENSLDPNQPDFTKIDLRVGKITKVWHHETAERLFCEEIDIGDPSGVRPVASGLRSHYTLEDMQDRLVVMVCNLKEAKMQGFVSTGMVLAAKSADGEKIELIDPPSDADVGDRLVVEGLEGPAWPSAKVKKLKLWESISADLKTNAECIACWQGNPLLTSKGLKPCKVKSNADMPIS